MGEDKPFPWATFKHFAAQYPDCGAVKLTIQLQRALIAYQQQLISKEMQVLLDLDRDRFNDGDKSHLT